MSIKTLFSIILKVLGIFFIKDIVNSMMQISLYAIMMNGSTRHVIGIKEVLFMAAPCLLYIAAAYMLIFKSHKIVGLLRIGKYLDDDRIELNIHRSSILSIAIIVIGGYMVVNEVPALCRQLFTYYQQKNVFTSTQPDVSYLVLEASKVIIGLLLVSFQRPIVNLIELKRRNISDDEEYAE
jgi:hypothetical protein